MRTVRGIEVTDDSLSVEAVRQVCTEGPGHFLGHPQTLELMEKDYVYPDVGDRTSPKEWLEQGSTDVVQRARKRTQEILASHYPDHIDPDVDAKIRRDFPIRLPLRNMTPSAAR
jgi:trimethylamine--corrinoid protein Co-methyltransferase